MSEGRNALIMEDVKPSPAPWDIEERVALLGERLDYLESFVALHVGKDRAGEDFFSRLLRILGLR